MSDLTLETRPCTENMEYAFDVHGGRGESLTDLTDFDDVIASKILPSVADLRSTIRSYFPETWLWDLYSIDNTSRNIKTMIPDTITQWDASAFCISPQDGIGIPPPQSITAFTPYFMDYTLPFSVKQGELVKLKISVFSYLNDKLYVSLIHANTIGKWLLPFPSHLQIQNYLWHFLRNSSPFIDSPLISVELKIIIYSTIIRYLSQIENK